MSGSNDITQAIKDIISRARARYIKTGITRNISIAVEKYLRNNATPAEISTYAIGSDNINLIRTLLKSKRPDCSKCGAPLKLSFNVLDQEGRRFPTAFECVQCGLVCYLSHTLPELIKVLLNES